MNIHQGAIVRVTSEERVDPVRAWHNSVMHEVSHIVVAHLLGVPVRSLEAWVRNAPGNTWDIGGRVAVAEPTSPVWGQHCRDQIAIALAGHAHECILGLRDMLPVTCAKSSHLSPGDWLEAESWLNVASPPLSEAEKDAILAEEWIRVLELLRANKPLILEITRAVLPEGSKQCGEWFGAQEVGLFASELENLLPSRRAEIRQLNIDRTNIRNYIEIIYIDSGNTGTIPGTGTITSTSGVAVFSVAQTNLAYGLRVIVAGTPYTITSIVTSTLVGLDGAPTFGASAFSFSNTASMGSVSISDPASIARFGLKYFKIVEGAGSPIDSAPEAASLANTVLSDLKDPKAEQEIEMPFFWPAELGDLYRFAPNGVHYNSNQDFAVVGIEHKLSMTEHRTTIRTRGKPAGAYLSWLNRSKGGIVPPASALALNDFKILSETPTTITYTWTPGNFVFEVWAADVFFIEPVPLNPWNYVLAAMAPLAAGTTTYTVNKVAEGQVRLVQLEPRDSNLTPGTVQRVVVNAPATQPPIYEFDDVETNLVGTQWWKITERGIAVAAVEVQTQVGIQPISGWGAPTRSAGAASTVRGGTLGAGEYEQDVDLDPTRQSWIMPRITLVNGSPPVVLGPFGFDRNKLPNILSVMLNTISATQYGTVLSVLADSDTKSIKITNSSLSWVYQMDGVSLTVDVSKTGTNGGAGLGSAASDTYTITAQSDAIVDVGGGTTTDVRAITISGPTAGAPTATWDTPGAVVTAPPTNGSRDLMLTLKATSAPVGWTAEAWLIFYSTHGTDNRGNVSISFTPGSLTTPPIVSTDYHYNATGFKRAVGGSIVTAQFTCYLKDGGGVVKDTKIANASWSTDFT